MNPKRTIAVVILSLLTGTCSMAQTLSDNTHRNEVRIGYGIITMPEMVNSLMTNWSAIGINISMDSVTDYSASLHGIATLEYNRFMNKWLTIGGSLSVNPINTVLKTEHDLTLTWSYYVLNIMPKVNFYYVNKEMFSMYSGIEVGLATIMWSDRQGKTIESDFGATVAFHVNAFGIRVGKQIGGFMEWGYGFRGIVNFGLSARL